MRFGAVNAFASARRDRDHALPCIIAACFLQPSGIQQRAQVAGEGGALHAQQVCQFTQQSRAGLRMAQDRILVEAQVHRGQFMVIHLRDLAGGAT